MSQSAASLSVAPASQSVDLDIADTEQTHESADADIAQAVLGTAPDTPACLFLIALPASGRRSKTPRSAAADSAGNEREPSLESLAQETSRLTRDLATTLRYVGESKVWPSLGYSHRVDFAREDLGIGERRWQQLARLDRALDALPLTDAALTAGIIALSHVEALIPVLRPDNELRWLRRAVRRTVRELKIWVDAALAMDDTGYPPGSIGASGGRSSSRSLRVAGVVSPSVARTPHDSDRSTALDEESTPPSSNQPTPSAHLIQNTPARSALAWDGFRREVALRLGRHANNADALEVLLAELWAGRAGELAERVVPTPTWPPRFCRTFTTSPSSADETEFVVAAAAADRADAHEVDAATGNVGPGSCIDVSGPRADDSDSRIHDADSRTDGPSTTGEPSHTDDTESPRQDPNGDAQWARTWGIPVDMTDGRSFVMSPPNSWQAWRADRDCELDHTRRDEARAITARRLAALEKLASAGRRRAAGALDGHAAGALDGHAAGALDGHTAGALDGHAVGNLHGHPAGNLDGYAGGGFDRRTGGARNGRAAGGVNRHTGADRNDRAAETAYDHDTPREELRDGCYWLREYHRVRRELLHIELLEAETLGRLSRNFRRPGFSNLEHYAKEKLGLSPRTLRERLALARLVRGRPYLKHAFRRGDLGLAQLDALSRLVRAGVCSDTTLHAWVERARLVTAKTYDEQVRWTECRLAANQAKATGVGSPVHSSPADIAITNRPDIAISKSDSDNTGGQRDPFDGLPPTAQAWPYIRAAMFRHPELILLPSFHRVFEGELEAFLSNKPESRDAGTDQTDSTSQPTNDVTVSAPPAAQNSTFESEAKSESESESESEPESKFKFEFGSETESDLKSESDFASDSWRMFSPQTTSPTHPSSKETTDITDANQEITPPKSTGPAQATSDPSELGSHSDPWRTFSPQPTSPTRTSSEETTDVTAPNQEITQPESTGPAQATSDPSELGSHSDPWRTFSPQPTSPTLASSEKTTDVTTSNQETTRPQSTNPTQGTPNASDFSSNSNPNSNSNSNSGSWRTFSRQLDDALAAISRDQIICEMTPNPTERSGRAIHINGPAELIESYQRAIAVMRHWFGDDKPAWWCREVMTLLVRRDWIAEDREALKRLEHAAIYARDGFMCTNPVCTARRDLHAHHITFRSRMGTDDAENFTSGCVACHEYGIHKGGTIAVTGTAPDGLTWRVGNRTFVQCGFLSCLK